MMRIVPAMILMVVFPMVLALLAMILPMLSMVLVVVAMVSTMARPACCDLDRNRRIVADQGPSTTASGECHLVSRRIGGRRSERVGDLHVSCRAGQSELLSRRPVAVVDRKNEPVPALVQVHGPMPRLSCDRGLGDPGRDGDRRYKRREQSSDLARLKHGTTCVLGATDLKQRVEHGVAPMQKEKASEKPDAFIVLRGAPVMLWSFAFISVR